jgi:predicted Zn-dependent protease
MFGNGVRRSSRSWLLPTLLVLGLGQGGCATNPATGAKQISLVSRGQEMEMGRAADPAIISEYGLYDDPKLAAYVDSVGQRLGKVSHLPTMVWHFRLLDSPVVNAFALPGGYIYITRGIVAQMNSEAQLAGVLGHEIGHVTARHSAQQITNQQIAQVGLLVGMIAFSGFREYGGLAAQGMGLLFLKYSRDHETQADELGVQYTARAKYDPRQIPATYETLKRIGEREGAGLPNFLSTHPDPGDRQVRTRQLAEATVGGAALNLEIGAANYRRHLEGLVYGDDPRAGYFENSRFYHPQLGFQLIFPNGWKTVNNPSAVIATNESMGATMQLTLGSTPNQNLTPSEYVDSLRIKNAIASANGRAEQFRDYPAWVGDAVLKTDQGQTSVAAGFVRIKPGQFLEIIGQSKGGVATEQIYAAIRSVAALTDPEKLNVTPDRIVIKPAPRTATFSQLWGEMGGGAIGVEDGSILNSTRATTTIEAGTPLKTVVRGKHS